MQGHGFKFLTGGLHAAVMPYNRADHIHRSSLGSLLGDIINYEAKVHDAPFDIFLRGDPSTLLCRDSNPPRALNLPRFSGHNPVRSKGSRSVQNEEYKTPIYGRV